MSASDRQADRWWTGLVFHFAIAGPVTLLFVVGLGAVLRGTFLDSSLGWSIGLVCTLGGVVGLLANSLRRQRSALLVWIPAVLVLGNEAYVLARSWSGSWSHSSRREYVMNQLFGPDCASSECLYAVLTMACLGMAAYSVGAGSALAVFRNRRGPPNTDVSHDRDVN